MKFKIGDFVRFVEEPIEGHITSFQNNDIIGVTDDSGFEIPVPVNKITLVHGNMRRNDDDDTEKKAAIANAPFIDRGIYQGIAGEQGDGPAKLYFINHTSYDILIVAKEINETKRSGVFAEKILAGNFGQFCYDNFTYVRHWSNYEVQPPGCSMLPYNATSVLQMEFRVTPFDLSHPKEDHAVLATKAWRYGLDKDDENNGWDKLEDHFISRRP